MTQDESTIENEEVEQAELHADGEMLGDKKV